MNTKMGTAGKAVNITASGATGHNVEWGNANIEVRSPTSQGTPMLAFHSEGATAIGLYEEGCRLYTTGSDGRKEKRILDIDDLGAKENVLPVERKRKQVFSTTSPSGTDWDVWLQHE